MLALSGVGVASILSGAGGVQVPLAGMLGSDIHAAWLASKPAASAQTASGVAASGVAASGVAGAAGLATPALVSEAGGQAVPPDPATQAGAPASNGSSGAGMTEDGKVILNSASVADLRHLPGVGQKRADAILALRTRLGRFKQVNDLLRVKGIGVRGLKKILPHVILDAPKGSV
ncbi:MAG: helix-hairpin-helix domain-containing protein [Polyangiaceae bacterium]